MLINLERLQLQKKMNIHGIKSKIRCDKRELNKNPSWRRKRILEKRLLTYQHLLIKKRAEKKLKKSKGGKK